MSILTEYDEAETLRKLRWEYEQRFKEEGRAAGRAEGRTEGEERFAALVNILINQNDQETLVKATTDKGFREECFAKYHL